MNTGFRIGVSSSGRKMVELLDGDDVIGAIYPTENGINIISAHLDGIAKHEDFLGIVEASDGQGTFPPIPSVQISFSLGPWDIVDGKTVKLHD